MISRVPSGVPKNPDTRSGIWIFCYSGWTVLEYFLTQQSGGPKKRQRSPLYPLWGTHSEKPPMLAHRGLSAVRKKRGRKEVPKEAAHGFRVPLYGPIVASEIELPITTLRTKNERIMNPWPPGPAAGQRAPAIPASQRPSPPAKAAPQSFRRPAPPSVPPAAAPAPPARRSDRAGRCEC